LIRDSYPFTGIDPVPYSSRVRAQGLSAQFRMILTRKHSSAQAHKLLDKESYIWDNMITINKRITHDNSKRIRRKIYRAWQQVQSFGSEAQEPARLRLWDDPAAARAGRPIRRGAGMHHGLASSAKLRHLYAIAAGPDGRQASSGGWRNGRYHSDQRTKVHGPQEEIQGPGLTDRGLRAPTPYTINTQALKRRGASTQAAGLKLRGAQGRKGAGAQAVGRKLPDHGSWTKYQGARLEGLD
jgi:hypothetical protein